MTSDRGIIFRRGKRYRMNLRIAAGNPSMPPHSTYTSIGSVSCSSQEQSPFSTEQHAVKPWLEPGSSSDPDSSKEPDLQNPCVHWLLFAQFAHYWLSLCIYMKNATRTNQERDQNPSVSREIWSKALVSSLRPLPVCYSRSRGIERETIKNNLVWALATMNI